MAGAPPVSPPHKGGLAFGTRGHPRPHPPPRSLECLELVTEIAQPLPSIIDIEKSRLPSHRIISDPSVTMESEWNQKGGELARFLEASSLRYRPAARFF